MDLQTIHMDPRIARIHYRDYVTKVREARIRRSSEIKKRAKAAGEALGRARIEKTQIEKEDEILLKSFRALARGERVLDIYKTLQRAGLQEDTKLPALAIAGATWKETRLFHQDNRIFFAQRNFNFYSWRSRGRYTGPYIDVPQDRFSIELTDWGWRNTSKKMKIAEAAALVPETPPHLRPDNLEEYHILWEPVWERRAPVDPVLLKHIEGPFYSIVAQWDLTSLEQSVLELRTPG